MSTQPNSRRIDETTPESGALPVAIQQLVRHIVQQLSPERIILFGSRACGDAEARSDYDIAVDAPDAPEAAWTRLVLDTRELPDSLLRIDLVRYDTASAELRGNIDKEGISLYGRPR